MTNVYIYYLTQLLFVVGEFCQVVDQNGRNELECSWGRKIPIINDQDFGLPNANEVGRYLIY